MRRYNQMQKTAIACYGDAGDDGELRRMFCVHLRAAASSGAAALPQLVLFRIAGPFTLGGVEIVPVPLLHGRLPVLGFRIGSFAYLTDCNRDSRRRRGRCSRACARSCSTRCATGRTRRTSASIEALEVVARLGAERAYFTHICHDLPHAATCARLPAGVELAYDGLVLEIDGMNAETAEHAENAFALRTLRAPRLIVALMDVIHFPDDPRPSRWMQPVLALGNFDGVHRGHRKILDRVRRVAERARRDLRRHDLRSASAARRPARQGAAAVDDHGAEARGDRRRPACRAPRSCASRPSCRSWDPETFVRTVLVDWLRVAEVWVGANFLFGHDRAGNFSMLRVLGARYGFKAEKIDPVRYKDFVVSSTRIRRLIGEGRVDEAGALLGHQYFLDGTVDARRPARPHDRVSDREPAAPRTSCCRRTASMRRPTRIGGIVQPSVTNVGVAADRGRVGPDVGRDAHLQLRPRSVRCSRSASASCSGCATSGRSSRWTSSGADRRRLQRARVLFDRLSL